MPSLVYAIDFVIEAVYVPDILVIILIRRRGAFMLIAHWPSLSIARAGNKI
jgi:hypothetical protein